MTNTDMIKELRALTSAGMKDCKDALEETGWDLQQAVDVIKTKGLNIADGRSGRVASEGMLGLVALDNQQASLIEVNCQTDFVANSQEFQNFLGVVTTQMHQDMTDNFQNHHGFFQHNSLAIETVRKDLVATTKENVVVRRWWVEQAVSSSARVFTYLHSNRKIGVILTLQALSYCPCMSMSCNATNEMVSHPDFIALGESMAMQVAAMNPLAIDIERLSGDDTERQKTIFEQQLTELNKPQAAWSKILEGKFRKWHTEVCLMEQESVWMPKTSVKQVVANTATALNGEIKIITMIRAQVGEGVEVKKDNLAEEVAKMM